MTKGQFVNAPLGTPVYPGEHPYGSRQYDLHKNWDAGPLGEIWNCKQGYANGQAPDPFPIAQTLGTPNCIANGEPAYADVKDFQVEAAGNIEYDTFDKLRPRVKLPDGLFCNPAGKDVGGLVLFQYTFFSTRGWRLKLHYDGSWCNAAVGGFSFVAIFIESGDFQYVRQNEQGPNICTPIAISDDLDIFMPIGVSFLSIVVDKGFGAEGNPSGINDHINFDLQYDPPFTPPVQLQNGFPIDCYGVAIEGLPHHQLDDLLECSQHATIVRLAYTDIVAAENYASALMGPDTTFYGNPVGAAAYTGFLVAKNPRRNFVWFTGTTSPPQLYQQFLDYVDPRNINGLAMPNIHYQSVITQLGIIASNIPLDFNQPCTFCGHSMGGSFAHIMAYVLRKSGYQGPFESLTFGQPKIALDIHKQIPDVRVLALEYYLDPIPALPPSADQAAPFIVRFPVLGPTLVLLAVRYEAPRGKALISFDASVLDGGNPLALQTDLLAAFTAWSIGQWPSPFAAHDIQLYENILAFAEWL